MTGHLCARIPLRLGSMARQILYLGLLYFRLFSVSASRSLLTSSPGIKIFIPLTAVYLAVALVGCYI